MEGHERSVKQEDSAQVSGDIDNTPGQNIAGTTTTGNPPDNHTAQGSKSIINQEQRPGDSGHMDTDESQEELNKQAARLRLNGDKTDGLSSQNLQPEDAENVEDVCSSLTPQAPQDRAVTISRSDTPHQGTTGNHITTDKYSMGEASNGQNTIENVAVFYWDALTAYNFQFLEDWLRKLLPMESMWCIPLCVASEDEWKCAAKKASYIVFYHSIQSGKSLDEATPYLDFCMGTHGPFKIIVMITGLEDSDSVAVRNKLDLSPYNLCHLLLVTKDEMTKFYSTNKGLRTGEREKMLEAELLTRPHRIGIFSRSAESDYQWLLSLLQSEFRDVVHEVRPCNISNIGAEVSQCTVAILYHSMNRGEVNNEELKYMSDILGKENVIVVVEGMKGRFPVEQSIGDYACDLVIITEAEKKDKARLMGRLESIRQSLKKPPKRKIRREEQKEERKEKCPDAELQQDIIIADDPGEMELGNEKYGQKMFIRKHHKIGIFSRSAESDYNWLQTSLRTEFRDLLVDVRAYYISNNGWRQFWEDVSQCSVGILYHTLKRGSLNITNVMDSLYEEELRYMAEVLGKENVFVVADDLQDSSSIEKHRILAQQPSIGEYSCDLVLLTPADKENKAQKMEKLETIRSALHLKENEDNLLHITRLKTKASIQNVIEHFPKVSFNAPKTQKTSFKQAKDTGSGKIETHQNYRAMVPYTADDTTHLPTGTQEQPRRSGSGSGTQHQRRANEQQPNSQRPGTSERKSSWGGRISSWTDSFMQQVEGPSTKEKHKVGIFSRSAEDDYRWLHRFIISEFSDYVQRVRPCYISNTGRRQFWEDMSQCSVAILYHTKKRGRINITDVPGSLYDEELQYLAEQLGKDKVMVVVDDLEDSGPEEKERILMSQRSIGKWASDLILISSTEKNYNHSTNSMYKQWLLQKFNRIAKV
ncbi:uncharacterized protein LOC108703977 isoform X2 [Xenopus laevis]|nr:uncharacterized protein LOC108703977 isoform X2 [Xenopus laevis]